MSSLITLHLRYLTGRLKTALSNSKLFIVINQPISSFLPAKHNPTQHGSSKFIGFLHMCQITGPSQHLDFNFFLFSYFLPANKSQSYVGRLSILHSFCVSCYCVCHNVSSFLTFFELGLDFIKANSNISKRLVI